MAGLPWIKVWCVIGHHPKVQRLERELGLTDGLGVVIRLWCWTAEYYPDGDIPERDEESVGQAAGGPLLGDGGRLQRRRDTRSGDCRLLRL